jgi:Glycosyltransferase family 87
MVLSKVRLVGALWLVGTLLTHALILWDTQDLLSKGYPDFTIYYTAGTMVRRGWGRQLYDEAKQFEVQRQFAPQVTTRFGALPFNHPPFEAAFFAALSFLSYRSAYWLWFVANLGMLAVVPIVLRAHVPLMATFPILVWILASLAFLPIFLALLQGQDAILLLLFYVLAFVALKSGRPAWAGAWLAGGLFKFHLVLPFLLLLLLQTPQRKRIAYGFAAVAAVLVAASTATVGIAGMLSYPRYVLGLEATTAGGAIKPTDMPNLRGLLSLIAPSLPNFNWVVILLSAILLLIAAWIARSSTTDARGLVFSLLLFTTVLVSYHSLGYDLCVLALPMLLLTGWLRDSRSAANWTRAAILVGWLFLLFSPLQLILLLHRNQLGWVALVLLLCEAGMVGELASCHRQLATSEARLVGKQEN